MRGVGSEPGLSWIPILGDNDRERALAIVRGIADDLRAHFSVPLDVSTPEAWSLAQGRSGVALFFAYLGRALGDDDSRAFASRLVEESLDAAAGQAALQYLFQGLTGVAWTVAHVDGWLFDLRDADPNDAVDDALLGLVTSAPWRGEYDLLSGLAGIGVYARERLPRAVAVELLSEVVTRLTELADQDPRYPFWWTPSERLPAHIRPRFPTGAWNLGAAHGVPGVIGLLALASAAGVASRPLMGRAVDWMMAQQLPAEDNAAFPSFQAPNAVAARSRLAWCYGDAGIAGVLLLAARLAGVPAWEEAAVTIAERAAAAPPVQSGVVDASVCHGSAGLAHIFNRLYQATRSPVLHAAADSWLEHVLDAWRPGVGVGSFVPPAGEGRLTPQPGFLTGAAGVGLVLLAACTPLEPRWDRLLLLS
jgi:lantibiotic biosynthesis protein